MSAAAVFALIANDGKADRMIMATKLLNQRIKDVMCARKNAGMADITPTLNDLERTHILFVNAHFKPFAAIGFEYNKVKPQSGNPTLGNCITFSIPQFGDFFHDMVGRQTLGPVSSGAQAVPAAHAPNTDWDGTTALTGATYTYVDAFGRAVTAGQGTYQNLVRYCEYPGERLYQKVKFDVNGNPLDEYNDVTVAMLRKFTVGADKITGYKRLVGQEVPMEGTGGPQICKVVDSDNNSGVPVTKLTAAPAVPQIPQVGYEPVSNNEDLIASAFPDTAWNAAALTHTVGANNGYADTIRQYSYAADGPQTPKMTQPALEIWNKLCFWFNEDVRLSIPSVSIPFGQRFITIDLAPQADLVFEFPGLYLRQRVGALLVENSNVVVSYRPVISAGTITDQTVNNVELYVNNIFVNPEVHDIFIKRIGFSLIRVYRFQRARTTSSEHDEKQLTSLKWPIEYMFIGLRPSWNINSKNTEQWRDWHRMSKVVDVVCENFDYSDVVAVITAAPATAANTAKSAVASVVPTSYARSIPTVDTLTVTSHGITLSDRFPQKFHNAYLPFHYGGPAIVTPDDEGALMINFSLFPRSYQPAGYLNLSRARETYVSWTTSYVTATQTADFLAVAIAINFLLITDGSAVLRYST